MDKRQQVWESLKNKEYREAFSSDVGTGIAFQIRLIRERLGWNQGQLGEKAGKAQPTIAQLENPDYGRFSLDSLKRLANAFDVALMVRFVSFSELVDWTVGLTPERLAPLSFGEEEHPYDTASALTPTTSNLVGATEEDVYFIPNANLQILDTLADTLLDTPASRAKTETGKGLAYARV